jgi:hypothetical protein
MPSLFYAAFGDSTLRVRAPEWGGTLRSDLQLSSAEASGFRSGPSWDKCCREQPELAAAIAGSDTALVIQGPVTLHESLDYLRETIELLSYLLEGGAIGVHDLFAQAWWSPQAWDEMATHGGIFNPFDHVSLLASPEPNGRFWLHTRGMRKFGRPDLSVRGVAEDQRDAVQKMIDRFINYQALGGVIEPGRPVAMSGLQDVYRPGPVSGNPEDPDFHNLHIEISRSGPG